MLLPLERVRRLFSLDIRHVCGLPAMFFWPETLFPGLCLVLYPGYVNGSDACCTTGEVLAHTILLW